MMHKNNYIKIIISTLLIAFFSSGCSSSNLNITHDNKNNIVAIDLGKDEKYIIKNAKKISINNGYNSLNSSSANISNYLSDDTCSSFRFIEFPELDRNQYYNTFPEDDVKKLDKSNTCVKEEFGNLSFHSCGTNYIITYVKFNNEGHLTQKKYLLTNVYNCFYKLRDIVISDNNSRLKENHTKINYLGSFINDENTSTKCVKNGKLELNIENQNITGTIYYKQNNNSSKITFNSKFTSDKYNDIITNIKDNISLNGSFSDNKNILTGRYSYDYCKGTFSVKRY